jgi:hypothetical protein
MTACSVSRAEHLSSVELEWIEFHRLVGVERFFLYDNGSSDGVTSEVPEVSSCDLQRPDTRQDHDQDAGRWRSALRTRSGVALQAQ